MLSLLPPFGSVGVEAAAGPVGMARVVGAGLLVLLEVREAGAGRNRSPVGAGFAGIRSSEMLVRLERGPVGG